MKFNIGDIILWEYPGDELSTIIEHFIDWDGNNRYILQTFHRNANQYLRDSLGEEELTRFIKEKVIQHIPIKPE